MSSTWEEFERWRHMIPERPDWHLHNWGCWRRGYYVARGYDKQSAGLSSGGASGVDAFEHLCEPVDEWAANVSDAIIDDLHILHQTVLRNVYEASVWTNQRINMQEVFVEAAAEFWNKAQKRDLT